MHINYYDSIIFNILINRTYQITKDSNKECSHHIYMKQKQ